MWGSSSGMFLQRRSYPEAYPLKPLRLSLNARVGEDVITDLSLDGGATPIQEWKKIIKNNRLFYYGYRNNNT
jgi:hypothetical protein